MSKHIILSEYMFKFENNMSFKHIDRRISIII